MDTTDDRYEQPTFEGMSVELHEVTVAAFNVIVDKPLKMYDEFEFRGRARVVGVSFAADKDKTGYLESGRRKAQGHSIWVELNQDAG